MAPDSSFPVYIKEYILLPQDFAVVSDSISKEFFGFTHLPATKDASISGSVVGKAIFSASQNLKSDSLGWHLIFRALPTTTYIYIYVLSFESSPVR